MYIRKIGAVDLDEDLNLVIEVEAPIESCHKLAVLDYTTAMLFKKWLESVQKLRKEWLDYKLQVPPFDIKVYKHINKVSMIPEFYCQIAIGDISWGFNIGKLATDIPLVMDLYLNIVNSYIDYINHNMFIKPQEAVQPKIDETEVTLPSDDKDPLDNPKEWLNPDNDTSTLPPLNVPPPPSRDEATKELNRKWANEISKSDELTREVPEAVIDLSDVYSLVEKGNSTDLELLLKKMELTPDQIREHDPALADEVEKLLSNPEPESTPEPEPAQSEQENAWLETINKLENDEVKQLMLDFFTNKKSFSQTVNQCPSSITKVDLMGLVNAIRSNDIDAWNRRITMMRRKGVLI